MRCPRLNELPSAPEGRLGWPWCDESPQLSERMPDGCRWPRISIVTPSFNQCQFIEETIRSVLLQGYPDLEYMIIDGGSSDGTLEIVRKYEDYLTHWVSASDDGQSDAINKGWESTSGDIVAWINADDTYCPGAFRAVGEMFQQKGDIVLVSGAANTTDISGETILFTKKSPSINPYTMLKRSGGVPTQPSVFLRRRVLDEVGFVNKRLHYVMDWELWIRLGLHYRADQFERTEKVLSNNRRWLGTKTHTGWRAICRENRVVFDDIFGKFRGDRTLQHIRRTAYSASYRKEASLARENGAASLAIKRLLQAWFTKPLIYNPVREAAFFTTVILGQRNSNRVKKWLSIKEAGLSREYRSQKRS